MVTGEVDIVASGGVLSKGETKEMSGSNVAMELPKPESCAPGGT